MKKIIICALTLVLCAVANATKVSKVSNVQETSFCLNGKKFSVDGYVFQPNLNEVATAKFCYYFKMDNQPGGDWAMTYYYAPGEEYFIRQGGITAFIKKDGSSCRIADETPENGLVHNGDWADFAENRKPQHKIKYFYAQDKNQNTYLVVIGW